MKKIERYFYPAVFTYEEGKEIAVVFPDLDVATSGVNDNDALLSARELLGCVMFGIEKDGEDLPTPTRLSDITVEKNERVVLIDVYLSLIHICTLGSNWIVSVSSRDIFTRDWIRNSSRLVSFNKCSAISFSSPFSRSCKISPYSRRLAIGVFT